MAVSGRAQAEPQSEAQATTEPPSSDIPQSAPAAETATETATETASPANILPASHWAQIPLAEHDDDDADSALDLDDAASSTASLTASILEYRHFHGRTYHSQIGLAESWNPNDGPTSQAMDLAHHLCTLVQNDKLYLAPLSENIQQAVDIGTCTGIWAIDFADEFPSAEVIGTDLSPMQPALVPPNLKFQIDDANLEWTWNDNTFDYIHIRAMFGSIIDWELLFRQSFRCCKPGGWIEDYEISVKIDSKDGSVLPGSPMDEFGKVFWEGGKKFGRTFRVIEDDIQKKYMEKAGFVDITVRDFEVPIGAWPQDSHLKLVGCFTKAMLETDIEGLVLYMWSQVMGWKPEEIQVYLAHLRGQLRDPNVHSFCRHRVVYGRKPQ